MKCHDYEEFSFPKRKTNHFLLCKFHVTLDINLLKLELMGSRAWGGVKILKNEQTDSQ